MKKIIMSFCILYCMLGYNCIGLSGWLSDVTDAAVNKAKTTVNKDKSYEQERNKAIAEKITQILADIRKQLLAGNEIDVKSSFAASLSRICLSMPMPYNRLSKEEIDKYVVENQQNFDALLSERETLKQKAQKELEIQQEKIQKEREVEQEKAQKKQDGEQEKAQEEIKQKENDLKREKYFQDTIGTQSEIDKENQMFQDKLAEYWSYVKDKNNLTEEELKANLVLQETHQLKLDKIDAEAYVKKLDKYEAVVAEEVANLKVKHTEELNSITTFQQAKAFLSST